MTTPTTYTDLCAQGEAAMEGTTEGPWAIEYRHGTTCLMMGDSCQMCDETYYPWTPDNDKDWHFIAWARNNVPALIAAIRELEARVKESAMQELASLGQAQDAYEAQLAAEAKLAEVEKERDEYQRQASKLQEEVMRLGRELNTARYGQPDFSWSIHKEAMAEMTARAEAAEATVATLTEKVEAMRGERDDAVSTLNAWFDRRKLGHEAVDKAVIDAASGYLRTSRVGGMPQEESDLILGVIQDMARLSLFADLFARAALTTENQTNG